MKVPARSLASGRFGPAAALLAVIAAQVAAGARADTLEQTRIARCQDLVRRQSDQAEILAATWHSWEDPVPRQALPAAALAKIKAHDLLYDGGIGGLFQPKAESGAQARKAFAYCSYDNLFVWLQGIEEGGVWVQFGATDYIAPY